MKYFLLSILFCLSLSIFSQNGKFPIYFGLEFRPIIPLSIIGNKTLKLQDSDYTVVSTQTAGYSFGATIRAGYTKLISLEYGLNYTQRNFNLSMSLADTVVTANDNWSLVNYEIPINLMIYIQLGKKHFMNASLGGSFRFTPTNIIKKTQTGGIHYFDNYGYLNHRLGYNLNANIGYEYRTQNKGFFYFGASMCIPLTPIIKLQSKHFVQQVITPPSTLNGIIDGTYLALDLKYFLPIINKKGVQPLKGPI